MQKHRVKFWTQIPHGKQVAITGLVLLLAGMLAVFATVNEVVNAGPPAAALSAPVFQDELAIELGSNGFNPAAVQHASGSFGIMVENSAIPGEYKLILKAPDGTVVKEVSVQQGSTAWTVTLQAGVYTLTEASNTQWVCQITVH